VLAVEMTASTTEVAGTPTLVVEGVLDLASVADLRDALTRLVRDHPQRAVLVDLDGVTAVDDVGLGILLGAAGRARAEGGELEIVCTQKALLGQLALTRLDQAVTVRSTFSR
jgi:anti-sigma B factor antagonist